MECRKTPSGPDHEVNTLCKNRVECRRTRSGLVVDKALVLSSLARLLRWMDWKSKFFLVANTIIVTNRKLNGQKMIIAGTKKRNEGDDAHPYHAFGETLKTTSSKAKQNTPTSKTNTYIGLHQEKQANPLAATDEETRSNKPLR